MIRACALYPMQSRAWRVALALTLGMAAPLGVHADATIYRCTGTGGHVTFTDEPCADGVRVDVRAGQGDPAAIARLRQEQEAFDRRDAQRRAALRDIELRRLEVEARRFQEADWRLGPMPAAEPGCAYCGGFAWYVPWALPANPPRPPLAKPRPPVQPPYLDFGKRR
jgi:hypothetical protein